MEPNKKKVGRPITQTKQISKTSQEGTKENETRATFIVNESLLADIKAIAYWDRIDIKTAVNDALKMYVTEWKNQNGPIEPIPQRR